jgi:hypothetical protein
LTLRGLGTNRLPVTRLAILDDVLPAQIAVHRNALAPVEVVWTGTDPARLASEGPRLGLTVLALSFDLLGGEEHAARRARELGAATGAELVILLHHFARREVIREAARTGARPVKTPVSLDVLRTHMTSVLVKGLLSGDDAREVADAPTVAVSAVHEDLPPRRFTREQLGRLREIESRVECECPNHVSELLLSLGAFEDYAAACESRNTDDAQIHALLHRKTAAARRIVEEALVELLRHERIEL